MDAIEVDRLTKRFGDLTAVDAASFSVPPGSVFGFLGPNGSGKTTTLGILTGLMDADEGTVRILGRDALEDPYAARADIGALIEEPAFYPHLSGRANLRLLAPLVGADRAAADAALDRLGLGGRANARYGTYSAGMRRRLGIAAALLGDPRIIVLDEPTSGLDPAGQQEMRRMLASLAAGGRTVLLSSHQLGEVQAICSHVAIIHRGRIVEQGRLADVLQADDIVELVVDDPVKATALLRPLHVEVEAGRLRVHAPATKAAAINTRLVRHGVAVHELVHRVEGLESRFLELTGGA